MLYTYNYMYLVDHITGARPGRGHYMVPEVYNGTRHFSGKLYSGQPATSKHETHKLIHHSANMLYTYNYPVDHITGARPGRGHYMVRELYNETRHFSGKLLVISNGDHHFWDRKTNDVAR